MPGRKPARTNPFAACQKAQIVFTAELTKAQAGPVAKSMPPIYSHKLVMTVKEVLRGGVKAGDEVIAHHSARQMKKPKFAVGKLCVVAVALADQVVADLPVCLFPTRSGRTWAAQSDGERFVIGVPDDAGSDFPITLLLNWEAGRGR